ncbi:YjbQ family protein [Pseudolabrys taiwanensis]|uniref:YjbQ family protein n=1 Tax=Pseudolabrys taiwanensis TaxID=331696 RepID=A0A345ZXH4_9HYPH|nr:secondary thiamine-phosphate synthase enzyme YjbQ [Pseudolabrys taiwanensis]AXK81621.1 YjbQ family protein [Pseudolabrys taiwanensis]
MTGRLSNLSAIAPDVIVSATLQLETPGAGFTEITRQAADFVARAQAGDGVLFVFLRHTSASLTIQENADPDVQRDLVTALDRLAPEDVPWVHDVEGPDDMPAHVKAMLNGVSLHIPVRGGALALGTWQGLYLVEHRRRPHSREVVLQFVGSKR